LLRRRRGIGGIFLLQLGPAAIVIAGLSFLLVWLGLIKAFAALLAIYLITGLAFCLWQMCRSYKAVPVVMEESAVLDGASVGQSFVRVVLPLAARGLIVSTLFSLVLAWIEYVIAGMLLRNTGIFPPPPATTGESFARQTVVSLVAIVAVTLFLLLGRLLTIRSNRAEPV
jgi:ABC-type glycerol-3-phosphate transport system permease component